MPTFSSVGIRRAAQWRVVHAFLDTHRSLLFQCEQCVLACTKQKAHRRIEEQVGLRLIVISCRPRQKLDTDSSIIFRIKSPELDQR